MVLLYIIVLVFGLLAATGSAAAPSINFPENFAGFSSADLKQIIENIVRIVVGFVGLVFLLLLLAGGLRWMTSGGNEDKIAEAKKLIGSAVAGLLIILMSYAIANFLVASLSQAL